MTVEEKTLRLLAQVVRAEPGALVEALGLDLDRRTARLSGLLDGRRATVSDGAGASARVDLTTGAMVASLHRSSLGGGLLVSAVPPGPVRLSVEHATWGTLGERLQRPRWSQRARSEVDQIVGISRSLHEAVDRSLAASTSAATDLLHLAGDDGHLPGPSRFAVAALAVALRSGAGDGANELCALAGPSHHPVVRLARQVGGVTLTTELGLGAKGEAQLVNLVWRDGARGPTWRRRDRDPAGYVAALLQTLPVVDAHLVPGGFLSDTRDGAEACGWELREGRPDRLLMERSGVKCSLVLRPPAAAGLRFVAPSGADIAFLEATIVAMGRSMAEAQGQSPIVLSLSEPIAI